MKASTRRGHAVPVRASLDPSRSQGTHQIWQTLAVRRSLGGLLLLLAAGFYAAAIGTFWLDRVAFSPSTDTDDTFAIIADEDVRAQVATLVATVDAPVLGMSPSALTETIEGLMDRRAMAAEMRRFVAEAHRVLIGEADDDAEVEIQPAEQVQIVRNENVALLPPIRVPVAEVGSVAGVNTIVGWTWIAAGGAGIVLTLLGLVVRPERGEFAFAFGAGCAATGIMVMLSGYVAPAALLPVLSDDTWMGVFPRLATKNRNTTLIGTAAFLVVGVLATFGTTGLRQRRQHSTPLAAARYREQQRWSAR